MSKLGKPRKQQCILYVGDFQELSTTLHDLLSLQSAEIDQAKTVESARALLSSKAVDFAILDHDIFGEHCYKLINMMSESPYPHTEFLLVTSEPSLDSALRAYREKQVAAYESKPLDVAEIAKLIQFLSDQNYEENLTNTEENIYNSILDSMKKGIWISDVNGNIRFTNKRMAQLLRCNVSELASKHTSEYIISEVQQPSDITNCSATIKPEGSSVAHIRRVDGSSFWAFTDKEMFESPIGTMVVDVFADISSQIQAEHLVTKQRTLLKHRAEWLKSVSDNLEITNDVISNRLRAPLWRISGICQYLLKSFSNNIDPEIVYCLQSLIRHSKDTTAILEELIDDNQIKAKDYSVFKSA